MNENIFRAYDIRGNAEQDLTSDVLVKIGFVLGNKVKGSGHFLLLYCQEQNQFLQEHQKLSLAQHCLGYHKHGRYFHSYKF